MNLTLLPPRPHGARRRGAASCRLSGALAAILLVGVAACDVPTESPKWLTRWSIPVDSTVISLADLLPSSVTVTPDGSAFALTLDATTFSATLGELCGCTASGSVPVKPEFGPIDIRDSVSLPDDVISATMQSWSYTVRVDNGFSFDPLRPSSDPSKPRGFLNLRVTSAGRTLIDTRISGATDALPPGGSLTRTLTLAAGVINAPVHVIVTVYSPEGDGTTFDTSQRLTINAQPGTIRVSEAQVRLENHLVSTDPIEVEADVPDEMIDRIEGGAFILTVTNPFQVTGTFQVTLASPGTTLNRTLTITPSAPTDTLEFSRDELRGLLENTPITLRAQGPVSGPGGVVTVRPGQELVIRGRLQLDIIFPEG